MKSKIYFLENVKEILKPSEVNSILKKKHKKIFQKLKKGDFVQFSEYRNENKFIFDGKKLISLDYKTDDYGVIPSEFTVDEFPNLDYFEESMEYNNGIWVRMESIYYENGNDYFLLNDEYDVEYEEGVIEELTKLKKGSKVFFYIDKNEDFYYLIY